MEEKLIRIPAETQYAEELRALEVEDRRPKPGNWRLSPWAVLKYLTGGKTEQGLEITPKYIGPRRLLEIAIASLLSDRALLLTGVPGTAKSWLAEHLAAAVSGHSNLLVQGTSGTGEDALRYGWNYARLIAGGPSRDALVPGPVMRAMESGQLVRIEELTRIPTEMQDALISILSEKCLPVPELELEIQARQGFNVLATANDQDKGIYPMSSALQRRFNVLVMPLPASLEEEISIVRQRVHQLGQSLQLPLEELRQQNVEKLLTLLRELRTGVTHDGKQKLKPTRSVFSPAETISMLHHARIQHHYFSERPLDATDLVRAVVQTFVRDDAEEREVLSSYAESVLRKRNAWNDWYEAFREQLLVK
ncbi:MAG: putative protein YehL [Saprospiraceae bacterium]|nr:putative protein YehL [Saprospiraceae bacterium]